jgi:hypothetical protein
MFYAFMESTTPKSF